MPARQETPPDAVSAREEAADGWRRLIELVLREQQAIDDGDIDRAAALHVERRLLRAHLRRREGGEPES